ncbi:mCG147842 [Mus musculus]|nr:mCG147842 [Mus musculus]
MFPPVLGPIGVRFPQLGGGVRQPVPRSLVGDGRAGGSRPPPQPGLRRTAGTEPPRQFGQNQNQRIDCLVFEFRICYVLCGLR